jgi:signal transduction histidine kinase
MTLVFPAAHAAVATREALGQAFFWFSSSLLTVIFVAEIIISLLSPGYPGWLTLPILTIIWITALVLRAPMGHTLASIAIGGLVITASVGAFAFTLANFSVLEGTSATFLLTTLKVAVTLIGGMVDRRSSGAVGVIIGYSLAEAAVLVGLIGSVRTIIVDIPAIAIAVGGALALELLVISRRRTRQVESPISMADAIERAARERRVLELRSSALVHDTILNELATLATTRPGPLSPRTIRQIRTSIELVAAPDTEDDSEDAVALTGALLGVIERLRKDGLQVDVSGDLRGLDTLASTTAIALSQAIEQCLVNVLRHSGVTRSELVVFTSATDLTAMITDAGRGFVESAVGDDRLGLRNSVRGRIASVGGSVQLWSSPGSGTSVVLTVPVLGEES